jgi:hypothetical protein
VWGILRWGNISAEALAEHEISIGWWGVSSAVLDLTDRQLAALIERGGAWLRNGYERRLMHVARIRSATAKIAPPRDQK